MSLSPWLLSLFGLMNTSSGLFWRWENGFTCETVEIRKVQEKIREVRIWKERANGGGEGQEEKQGKIR